MGKAGHRYKQVNPDHLFLGTHLANMHDMDAKGRRVNTPHHGMKHGMAKLTDKDVRAIRTKYEGISNVKVAAMYGVNNSLVSMIRRRVIWRHVA